MSERRRVVQVKRVVTGAGGDTNERTVPMRCLQPAAAVETACPQCGAGMVMRTARKGANAGGIFWGCSNFPSCRGVRQAS